MKSLKVLSLAILSMAILAVGCQDKAIQENVEEVTVQKTGKAMPIHSPFLWENCEAYGTVVTPTEFDPDNGPFDRLFNGDFKDGLGHISDAAPGDTDYNGGRWAVYVMKPGVTTDYSNACSIDDINMDDFMKAGVYFECPVIPLSKGNSGNGNNGNDN